MCRQEIKKEWEPYYKALEAIRRTGVCNMFGAAPYLAEYAGIDEDLAKEVLVNWMCNYKKLAAMYEWRD